MGRRASKPASAAASDFDARGLKIAVVAARYNDHIIDMMLTGARAAWQRCGGKPELLRVETVPGSFELPLAARKLAKGGCDAVVALGCVIRGETAHFEYVSSGCALGLQQAMQDTGVPMAFGVLTTENEAQAIERAAPDRGDKGGEAVLTAIAMARLLQRL